MRLVLLSLIILASIISITSCAKEKSQTKEPQTTTRQLDYTREVTFLNDSSEPISTVRVAVADEPEERNQGLMDVTELPSDAGMLFIFSEEQELSFYMANTPLPLDIIYVNNDSTIVRIHHSTSPFSSKQLRSGQPARYVVETNGGYCVSNDIREGQKIRF
ncbi:DUF192 domain-containing protein [Gracilimonas mengyeensis]|nr:DUF192 domain-containing protein [Gracilimonas mengyeensis]